MILTSLLLLTPLGLVAPGLIAGTASPAPVSVDPAPSTGDLFAIKARRVEIGDGEVMEHAVILVEGGKIITMGQDLPIERGIRVIELDDSQVVMPGLVNPYTRFGMSGGGYNDSRANVMASDEIYPSDAYEKFLENGFTTVAQYPDGQGVSGQAVALRPQGDEASDMIVKDSVYVRFVMRNSSSSKRNVRDGFKKADDHLKKVETEREKFEKKNAKKKKTTKKTTKKKDDDEEKKKDEEKKEDTKKSTAKTKAAKFEAPEPDARVQPFLDLRDGKLQALFSIDDAAAYVHLVDAIDDEEFQWHLHVPLTRDINVFHVKDKIGEKGCFVLMEPLITLMPGTMRQRNLPAEFDRAGAKLVLIPRRDNEVGFKQFLEDVGVMISAGLDRKSAVRAITQAPAEFLGLGDQLGSLQEGRSANLVIFSGDPFQPGTKIDAVMLEGAFVSGEMNQ